MFARNDITITSAGEVCYTTGTGHEKIYLSPGKAEALALELLEKSNAARSIDSQRWGKRNYNMGEGNTRLEGTEFDTGDYGSAWFPSSNPTRKDFLTLASAHSSSTHGACKWH